MFQRLTAFLACLLLQRIQRCVTGNFTGVHFDYIEDFNQPPTSGLGLSVADYAAHLAWAVAVAKNLGLAVSTQEGFLVLAPSGIVPQLDMAITTNCMYYNGCDAYNILSEYGSMRVPDQLGSAADSDTLVVIVLVGITRLCTDVRPLPIRQLPIMSPSWDVVDVMTVLLGNFPVAVVVASPPMGAQQCCATCPFRAVQLGSYGSTLRCNHTTPLPPSTTPCVRSKLSLDSVGC